MFFNFHFIFIQIIHKLPLKMSIFSGDLIFLMVVNSILKANKRHYFECLICNKHFKLVEEELFN